MSPEQGCSLEPDILVVDDEQSVITLHKRLLVLTGLPHNFRFTTSGSECAELLLPQNIPGGSRLILTDFGIDSSKRPYPQNPDLQWLIDGGASTSNYRWDGPDLVRLARTVEGAREITNQAIVVMFSGGGYNPRLVQELFPGESQRLLDAFFPKPFPSGIHGTLLSLVSDPATDANDRRLVTASNLFAESLAQNVFTERSQESRITKAVEAFKERLLAPLGLNKIR